MQRKECRSCSKGVKSSLGWARDFFSSPKSYFPRIHSFFSCDGTQDPGPRMGIFTFDPILSARQCRQRLGQLCSGRLVPHRRIIPRLTNRAECDQLDHLSRGVGHQRLELLAPGVARRHCSHESSRKKLSMLPIQRRLTSSRFASTMAQAAQRNIKASYSPSFISRASVHTSISIQQYQQYQQRQHLARHKSSIHSSAFKTPRFNNPDTMVSSTSVNRTSLHPGGVQ